MLVEGIPIRLTGQDTERGTFSHRHAVLHDVHTGETFTPLQNLDDQTASFEIYNSPLSEYACLGFEYGYSVAAAEALVLWEAQFGDFVNGAQIVIDQFIVAGLSKWRETTRLTLLLPHGYEGNGPEHSSARLERFLQLAAQENIRVANCSTSGQYFHLLRRQALDAAGRPLVVMTPKGLLRLKQASSTVAELAEGSFLPVIDDPEADHDAVTRLVFCSGKVYYDIVGHAQRAAATNVAVARLEQLYPFPVEEYAAVVAAYPNVRGDRLGAGRAAEHGRVADDPTPARSTGGAAQLRRPAVAGQSERGLPDRTPARAGPHRPRGARPVLRALRGAGARPRLQHFRGDLRPVLPGDVEDLLALARWQTAPDVPGGQRNADRAGGASQASHAAHPRIGLVRVLLMAAPVLLVVPVAVAVLLAACRARPGRGVATAPALAPAPARLSAGGVTAGACAAAGVALGFEAASCRLGVFVWTVTTRRLITVGRIGGLTLRRDLGCLLRFRRGGAGATWIRTAGYSDGGAAARGPPGLGRRADQGRHAHYGGDCSCHQPRG